MDERQTVSIQPAQPTYPVDKRPITYVSQYSHTLDARGRVFVPADWRVEGDEQNYYLAWVHPEGCITFFTPEMQQELFDKIKNASQSNIKQQELLRKLFGNAKYMGCDKQGRILLPQNLCEQVGIKKDVILVGLGRNFQIWAAERWTPPQFNLLEAMSELGI
jgi:MraZ protein